MTKIILNAYLRKFTEESMINSDFEANLINFETDIKNYIENFSSENIYVRTYSDESLLEMARHSKNERDIYYKLLAHNYILVSHNGRRSRFSRLNTFQSLDPKLLRYENILYKLEAPLKKLVSPNEKNRLVVVMPGWGNDFSDSSNVLERTFASYFPDLQQNILGNTTILRIADFNLSHGSFYLNTELSQNIESNIQALIKNVRTANNVDTDAVVMLGIQNGGLGAIYHGLLQEESAVIAVTPIIDSSRDEHDPKKTSFQVPFRELDYTSTINKLVDEIRKENNNILIIDNSTGSPTYEEKKKLTNKIKFHDLNNPLADTVLKISQVSRSFVITRINLFLS